jgi:signal transduction histidine kinase
MRLTGKIRIVAVTILVCLNLQVIGQGQKMHKIDSLENKLRIAPHDTVRVLLYSELATEYMSYNTDSALTTGLLGIDLAIKADFAYGEALCRTVVSTAYSRQANYPAAMEHTMKSLRIGENTGDKRLIAMNYEMLGVLCTDQANDSLGLYYYEKAISISREFGFDDITAWLLNDFGQLYDGKKEYEKALDCYREELLICTKLKDQYNLLLIYLNVGDIYLEMGEYPQSLSYLEKSLKLAEDIHDKRVISASLMLKAKVFFKTGKPLEAVEFSRQSLEIALSIKNVQFIRAASRNLFDYYSKRNDYKNALEYYRIGQAVIDSTLGAERTRAFNNLVYRNENYYRQKEIELLQKDRKVARLQSIIIAGILMIVFITAILVYRSRRKIGRINFLLELKNGEINSQAEKLKEANTTMEKKVEDRTRELEDERKLSLKAILVGQEAERERIAKDLHDSLSIRMIGLKRMIESNVTPYGASALFEIDAIIGQVREISHNLLPYALKNFGLVKAIEDLCSSVGVRGVLAIHFSKINIGPETRWESTVETELFRVVQELLTNIVKHAAAKNVVIELIADKNMIFLSVEDDGKGFDSGAVSGNGIGLSNMKARINLLGGTINYDTQPGKGTVVFINIPTEQQND